MPKDLKLSVFLTEDLSAEQIWMLGQKYVSPNIYGRAELTRSAVSEIGLRVEVDNKPLRHANVVGWPVQKSEQKLYALKMAEKSSLYLKPERNLGQ
jgi:hypothetical protein